MLYFRPKTVALRRGAISFLKVLRSFRIHEEEKFLAERKKSRGNWTQFIQNICANNCVKNFELLLIALLWNDIFFFVCFYTKGYTSLKGNLGFPHFFGDHQKSVGTIYKTNWLTKKHRV